MYDNKAFRHVETLFVQGNQVHDYLGRIKFLHVYVAMHEPWAASQRSKHGPLSSHDLGTNSVSIHSTEVDSIFPTVGYSFKIVNILIQNSAGIIIVRC